MFGPLELLHTFCTISIPLTKFRLCGFPPFYADDDDALFDQVIAGQYTFLSPYWDGISADAKEFIAKMLESDPKKRITAAEALQHKWVLDNTSSANLSSVIAELKKFNAKKRWRKGINTVVALEKMKIFRLNSEEKNKEEKSKEEK